MNFTYLIDITKQKHAKPWSIYSIICSTEPTRTGLYLQILTGDNTNYILTYLYIDPLVFVQPRENEDPTCMRKKIYFPKQKNPEKGILLKIYSVSKVLHLKRLPGPLTPCIFPRRKTTIRSDSLNLQTSFYRTDTGNHKCRGDLFYWSL